MMNRCSRYIKSQQNYIQRIGTVYYGNKIDSSCNHSDEKNKGHSDLKSPAVSALPTETLSSYVNTQGSLPENTVVYLGNYQGGILGHRQTQVLDLAFRT